MEDIMKELCVGCGEVSPKGQGIFAMVSHSCRLNTVNYRPGNFTMRKLTNAFLGKDPLKSFKELLRFEHFEAYDGIVLPKNWIDKREHPLERMLYAHARNFEIKQMNIIWEHIDLEEELDSKW